MRVIVCGSRGWNDRDHIAHVLADLPGDSVIVHGNAHGADRIAESEAQKLGLLIEAHPYQPFISATVSAKRAPLERNEHMASLGADLCIAFWDGLSNGTLDMVRQATVHQIPTRIVPREWSA